MAQKLNLNFLLNVFIMILFSQVSVADEIDLVAQRLQATQPKLVEKLRKIQKNCISEEALSAISCDLQGYSVLKDDGNPVSNRVRRAMMYSWQKIIGVGRSTVQNSGAWLRGDRSDPYSAGKDVQNALLATLGDVVSEQRLRKCEAACVAACATKTLVQFGLDIQTLFADPYCIIQNGKGMCVDMTNVMQELSNGLGVPTRRIVQFSTLIDTISFYQLMVHISGGGATIGTISSFASRLHSSPYQHYSTRVTLDDGIEYFFDPVFDYSFKKDEPGYSCKFYSSDYRTVFGLRRGPIDSGEGTLQEAAQLDHLL